LKIPVESGDGYFSGVICTEGVTTRGIGPNVAVSEDADDGA